MLLVHESEQDGYMEEPVQPVYASVVEAHEQSDLHGFVPHQCLAARIDLGISPGLCQDYRTR